MCQDQNIVNNIAKMEYRVVKEKVQARAKAQGVVLEEFEEAE